MFLGSLAPAEVFAASDPFPIYGCLEQNVAFWKKVFTQYSSNQGIIHDSRHLSIIYGIIELQNAETRGARKINKNRIKAAKKKYRKILRKLARGDSSTSIGEGRVADLFGPNTPRIRFLRATGNIRCQIGQRDRFREGLVRSGAFLDQIKAIFQSYNLPTDLAYLPHVESSFNLAAYSKFGAAGIWQFIRSTGKRYLRIDDTLDERRDPIRSTHAAAKLLKANYEMLGTWPMAITAYNHGLAGMLRAKRAKGNYLAIFAQYKSRLFKFASRNFYSEFLAARHIAKNYRKYFGELEFHKPVIWYETTTEGYLPMTKLARYFDIDMADIKALNPSLRSPVYTGQKYIPKGYALRLPLDVEKYNKNKLFNVPQHLYKPKQKRSLFYRVRKGDTAGEIARNHGIGLSELTQANNLDFKATIYVGQNLRLPWPDEKLNRLIAPKVTEKSIKSVFDKPAASKKQPNPASQITASNKGDAAAFGKERQADNLPINLVDYLP
jgi:membrane-bound lytic murein transglycosylase D